jgi:hypothetical protein
MSMAERTDVVDMFQAAWEDSEDPGFKSDDNLNEQPYVLISTNGIMGTGLTCNRASQLILVEPDYIKGSEDQGKSRILRIGQYNSKTYTYRLWCPEVKVEKAIVKRQELRAEFEKMTFEAKEAQKSSQAMDNPDLYA